MSYIKYFTQSKIDFAIDFFDELTHKNLIKKNKIDRLMFQETLKEFCNLNNKKITPFWILQIFVYLKIVHYWNNSTIFLRKNWKQSLFIEEEITVPCAQTSVVKQQKEINNVTKQLQSLNLNSTKDFPITISAPPIIPNKIRTNFYSDQLKKSNNISVQSVKEVNKKSKSKKKNKTSKVNSNISKLETKYFNKDKCDLCNIIFNNNEEFLKHSTDKKHDLRHIYRVNKLKLKSTNKDIQIRVGNENNFQNEIKLSSFTNCQNKITLTLKNNSNVPYDILDIILLYTKLKEVSLNGKIPMFLNKNATQNISVSYCFNVEGKYLIPIVFKANNKSNNQIFYILKELLINVDNKIASNLKSDIQSVYQDNKGKKFFDLDNIVEIYDGVRPKNTDDKIATTSSSLQLAVLLGHYNLPNHIVKLLNNGLQDNQAVSRREKEEIDKLLSLLKINNYNNCLTPENYCNMLESLLYFEEHQMQINIREYDCENQKLYRIRGKPDLLSLNVPGLAEDRPSLIKGDNLIVFSPNKNYAFRGFIHYVEDTTVQLGFDNKFVHEEFNEALNYNVSFGFNRHTLRTEHQAVALVKSHKVQKCFFPKMPSNPRELLNIPFVWFENKIKDNLEQQQAVKHIVSGTSYPAPYLLFGPPGTGKTMTVVEAILQLWKLKPKCKILVAAPSNFAANEVSTRLIKFITNKRDLFRMISVSFDPRNIPTDLKPYCNYRDGEYYYPDIEVLESYRILIVTLTAAAKLVNGGITPAHFSHIFIDESGHSTESEVLIPIAGIITQRKRPGVLDGHVVLAGDPEQLGPIIHSKLAKRYGFGTSMLERLMKHCDLYKKNQEGKYNPNMVTKLLKNFRSHNTILELPNKLFYESELKASGEILVNVAVGWSHLPNKKFPLIFHNVKGQDEKEENSPSYFNKKEIKVVIDYLNKLIGTRLKGKKIEESDIGIVSPYRKQVQKLQFQCRKKNWRNILIGSVEQFQGQERLIIIISTVRSTLDLVEHDYQFHLGFLKNPKRFNVAITRAKSLVIVVGNPDILLWDPHWGQFIEYCKNNNATAGPPFEFRQSWLKNKTVKKTHNMFQSDNYASDDSSENDLMECANFSRGRK